MLVRMHHSTLQIRSMVSELGPDHRPAPPVLIPSMKAANSPDGCTIHLATIINVPYDHNKHLSFNPLYAFCDLRIFIVVQPRRQVTIFGFVQPWGYQLNQPFIMSHSLFLYQSTSSSSLSLSLCHSTFHPSTHLLLSTIVSYLVYTSIHTFICACALCLTPTPTLRPTPPAER
jgi:hypothetical protein